MTSGGNKINYFPYCLMTKFSAVQTIMDKQWWRCTTTLKVGKAVARIFDRGGLIFPSLSPSPTFFFFLPSLAFSLPPFSPYPLPFPFTFLKIPCLLYTSDAADE